MWTQQRPFVKKHKQYKSSNLSKALVMLYQKEKRMLPVKAHNRILYQLTHNPKGAKGKLSTCEHRSRCQSPSWSELGQTHFPLCSSLHLQHNEPVTFPGLPVPIYTPGWRGVIMVKCLTQGHNTLTVTGFEPTTFCLWIQHWSARPHAPTKTVMKNAK